MSRRITILDGPTGTLLAERGVPTPLPGWSAHAIETHPEVIRGIHAEYAEAGATVHTACTFRTTPRAVGDKWKDLAARAIELAREGSGGGRIAASIAPLEDCYRPDLSPANDDMGAALDEHKVIADHLSSLLQEDDILLVETFSHPAEFIAACTASLAAVDRAPGGKGALPGSGKPEVWASLSPGYSADLLEIGSLHFLARIPARAGASAVLVNCVPARGAMPYLSEVGRAARKSEVPFGVYANAGHANDKTGWTTDPIAASNYADLAEEWAQAGATIIGGCCGTGPNHIRELARRFGA